MLVVFMRPELSSTNNMTKHVTADARDSPMHMRRQPQGRRIPCLTRTLHGVDHGHAPRGHDGAHVEPYGRACRRPAVSVLDGGVPTGCGATGSDDRRAA